ncbi:MAG TPA: hypothetical protein VNO33_11550 [Kofleriaceae bacterium]|nr:hypothetical protein [Kofleriaceae bacterium]
MPSSRLSLLLVLIGVLIASFGSSFAGEREGSTAQTSLKAKAAPAAKMQAPQQSKALKASPATGDQGAQQCTAKGPAGEDIYPTVAAACPTGWPWTCCPCGGCGCRPPWMSPANFCAC